MCYLQYTIVQPYQTSTQLIYDCLNNTEATLIKINYTKLKQTKSQKNVSSGHFFLIHHTVY